MRSIVVSWLSPIIGGDAAALLVPGWFACIGVAWLVVSLLTLRAAGRRGDDVAALAVVLAVVYAAALVGGIALPALVSAAGALWSGHGLRLRWSGMVSYAGFACGAVALVVALRRSALRPARAADLLAAPLGIGLCVGRLGCFLAGCDYGQVSSLPWAVRFPAGTAAWRDHVRAGWISPQREESLPVHPTQVYEGLLGLALCAAALVVGRTAWARRGEGRVFAVVAGGYALGRIAIENARGDIGRGLFGPWSSAQIVCALVLAALAVLAWRGRRWARMTAAAASAAILVVAMTGTARAQRAPGPTFRVGGTLVGAAALNRRERQVPALGGASLTGGVGFGMLGVEIDLVSVASEVAAHQSATAVLVLGGPVGSRLLASGRVGLGFNVVDFDDPAFEDVGSRDARAGLELGFALSPHWWLIARPIEIDVIEARALGGPIWTYQLQIGVAYRFGPGTGAAATGPRDAERPDRSSSSARPPSSLDVPSPDPSSSGAASRARPARTRRTGP